MAQMNEGFTPLELEAMRRARAGEKMALAGGELKPADLAEKEREFDEAGGEVAAPAWGRNPEPEPAKGENRDRLASLYEAAGAPVQPVVQESLDPLTTLSPVQPVVPVMSGPAEPASVQPAVPVASPAMACQRCGYVAGTPLVDEPSVEDQRVFVRSVLGRKRFIRTFHFFGEDGLDATFRNVLPGEYDVIRKVMQWMIRSGDARTVDDQFVFQQTAIAVTSAVGATLDDSDRREFDPPDIVVMYEDARKARRVALAEKREAGEAAARGPVSRRAKKVDVPPEPEEIVYDEITRRSLELGPVLLVLTQGSYRMEELYRMLVARAHDRGFWSGASGE